MSNVAMEFRCMKSIRVYVPDKNYFILSDHKLRCKSFQQSVLFS